MYRNKIDPFLDSIHKRHGGIKKWVSLRKGKVFAIPEVHCNHRKTLMDMYTTSTNNEGYASYLTVLDIDNYDGARPTKTKSVQRTAFVPTAKDPFCFKPPFRNDAAAVCCLEPKAGNCLVYALSNIWGVANISNNEHLSKYYTRYFFEG